MLKWFMDNVFVVASVLIVITWFVVLWLMSRFRQMRELARKQENERAMEQDAIRRAGSKLKYINSQRKQREDGRGDPLKDLFGVEAPTTVGPVMKKPYSGKRGDNNK